MAPTRLIHTDRDIEAIADGRDEDPILVERDFVLVTIAAELVEAFPGNLCFKGGFVLRHAHGKTRFSEDIDATRHDPAKKQFDAADVAETIGQAGGRFIRIKKPKASTDSPRSLDFDPVSYVGPLRAEGEVACEISYREAVVDEPIPTAVGQPFYEPFTILTMTPNEIGAEKLRCLGQRLRPTDLSDLYFVLVDLEQEVSEKDIARIFPSKVPSNKLNDYADRIERNLDLLQGDYVATAQSLDPDAPSFQEAREVVLGALPRLIKRP